jgi:hypothetical protein
MRKIGRVGSSSLLQGVTIDENNDLENPDASQELNFVL